MNNLKNMQGLRDINKSPVKYIDLDQSRNKDIYLIKFKNCIYNVHSRLWTFELQNIRNVPSRIRHIREHVLYKANQIP